jgi:D-alanyl-D-alanine carboxypeptidase
MSWQHHGPLNAGVDYREPARRATRRIPRILVAGLLVVIAALAAVPGYHLLASSSTAASPVGAKSSSSTAASPVHVLPGEHLGAPGEGGGVLRTADGSALGEADGSVPSGTTVFDDDVPGVAKLHPALLGALRRAANDAARHGVEFNVDSGWRSPKYQEQLLQAAIAKYGSEEEAARWVATPDTSPHVSGEAVDLGPAGTTRWLSEHGAMYGLCQIYGNEPWHYELRPEGVSHGCPAMYVDPTHDPRMRP